MSLHQHWQVIPSYIRDENTRLLTLVIQYPFFEKYSFTNSLVALDHNSDNGVRYDAYATMVFNMLSEMYESCREYMSFYHGNSEEDIDDIIHREMNNILGYEEYIFMHRNWWEINKVAYIGDNSNFVNFIDKRLQNNLHYMWMEI